MSTRESAADRLSEIAVLYWAQDAVINTVMQQAKSGSTEMFHLCMAVRAIHEQVGKLSGAKL